MVNCAVINCKNYTGRKKFVKRVRYFSFPKEPKLLRAWVKFCGGKENINPKTDRICSVHFDESDYRLRDILLGEPILKRRLKENAVPSRNIAATSSPVRERKKVEPFRKVFNEADMSSYGRSKEEGSTSEATYRGTGQQKQTNQRNPARYY